MRGRGQQSKFSKEDGVWLPSLKLGALRFRDPRHQFWGPWEILLTCLLYTFSKCEALTKQGTPGSHTSPHHHCPVSEALWFSHNLIKTLWKMGMRMSLTLNPPPRAQTLTFTLHTLSRRARFHSILSTKMESLIIEENKHTLYSNIM